MLDGAAINAFNAEVEFDVNATASELAAEVAGANVGDELDEANSVVVASGGPDVTAEEAHAIQDISGYVGTQSDYDISDSAANLISAGNHVLDVSGVSSISVDDGPATASEGAAINGCIKSCYFL